MRTNFLKEIKIACIELFHLYKRRRKSRVLRILANREIQKLKVKLLQSFK